MTDAQKKFMTIRKMILDLHECRKRLLSSNLTVEGLKELKKQVASIIDAGNRYDSSVIIHIVGLV
jgi:hypothetical protein